MGDHEAQELARLDVDDALLRIQLHLELSQFGKYFCKLSNVLSLLLALN